ncbi:MAG TPA: DUF6159 family protein [Vicinamibacterales bacterium]|nr:DUF6159 family protein [Vicinamibacterales bacterium]
MGRIGRSFQLVGQSYRILMQDKELMVLPLISGVIMVAVLAGAAFGFGIDTSRIERHGPDLYLPLFLMYVVTYAIGIFFQAAVVAGATERMRGGDPTVSSALGAAGRRLGPILMWAIVAATVGVAIRAIHDRVPFLGKILASVLGVAWSLATFFIVPVLVFEEQSIPDSFRRSVSVFRKTWGETVVGGTTLGAAGVCAWLTLIAITGLLSMAIGVAAVAVFFAGAVFLMIFFSALQGIYVASLYRFATDGGATPGLDPTLMRQAFVPKTR